MQQPPDILVNGLQKQSNVQTNQIYQKPILDAKVPQSASNQNFLGIDLQAEFLNTQETISPRECYSLLYLEASYPQISA